MAPSLVKFGALLPVFRGSHQAQAALQLPDELEAVPVHVLQEMVEASVFPSVDDSVLVEFLLTATRLGFSGAKPSTIPARVHRVIEPRAPWTVFLASTDEEEDFLQTRQRPYLRVEEGQVDDFVETVGCRKFADSFSFAMVIEGQRKRDLALSLSKGGRGL